MSNIIEMKVDATRSVSSQDEAAAHAVAVAEAYPAIDSKEVCEYASADLRDISVKKKMLNDERMKITRPMDEAKNAVMALFKPALERLEHAEFVIKGKINVYLAFEEMERRKEAQRQEELRRQEMAQAEMRAAELRRIANEKAEVERRAAQEARDKADAEALAQMRQAEEARLAGDEAAAMEAEQAAAAQRERAAEEQRVADERAMNAQLDAANAAEDIRVAAATAGITIAAPLKVAGVSRSGTWKAEVTDKKALIAYVAQHPEFLHLLDINASACNAAAKSMKEHMRIDGLQAVCVSTVTSRGRATA